MFYKVICRFTLMIVWLAFIAGCSQPSAGPFYPAMPVLLPVTPAAETSPLPSAAGRVSRFQQTAASIGAAAEVTQIFADVPPVPGTAGPVPVMRVVFDERAFFDFDRSTPRPGTSDIISLVADNVRRDTPGAQLTLLGHTDALGSDSYNDDLSLRRARIILQALISQGVNPAQLSAVAIGKRQPIAPNNTEEGRARNRRVEFLLSDSVDANLGVVHQAPIKAAWLTPDIDLSPRRLAPVQVAVLRPAPAATDAPIMLQDSGLVMLQPPSPGPQAGVPRQPPASVVPTALPPTMRPSRA